MNYKKYFNEYSNSIHNLLKNVDMDLFNQSIELIREKQKIIQLFI